LEQPAAEADAKLRRKGELAARDALDAHVAELLQKFGAPTYAVPPDFKARLRHHIERIRGAKGLPAARARMASFLPVIQRELSARGLPAELGYLPWTESRFDPAARSASGSLGIWQFTDATARRYGLRVDAEVDDRRDVEKSSRAAAEYLANLIADFGPEAFMLALASYNMGEARLRGVLHQLAQEPGGLQREQREFWHLYRRKLLSAETLEYVPGVLAAAIVFSHPRDYGL
jgi:membrane-bound lytic murein transglycosylase D